MTVLLFGRFSVDVIFIYLYTIQNSLFLILQIVGVALWIVVDVTTYGLAQFENEVSKRLLAADLNITMCKKVGVRGK